MSWLKDHLRFPVWLTAAESKLVAAAKEGGPANYTVARDPDGANWGPERTIRAEVIYTLATSKSLDVHAKGVRVLGAKITGVLDLEGAEVPHPLSLENCFIAEPIILRDATALMVSFEGSHVAGIQADRLHARGDVILRNGFHAAGEVRLSGAKIGGDLDCLGGRFENANGPALNADAATVGGNVLLRNGFHAMGEVVLVAAKIGGNLECDGGRFENTKGYALSASTATVNGNLFFHSGFQATGEVRLVGAKIGGQLACSGATFSNPEHEGIALNLQRASVAATLFLSDLATRPTGTVDLRYAQVGDLVDDEKSWPNAGKLRLDGFVYTRLASDSTPWRARDWRGNKGRLSWLSLQSVFHPQPYEQLAKVLRDMGHDGEAREVEIAKREESRPGLGFGRGLWDWFLDRTIGYGLKPQRAGVGLLLALFFGWMLFQVASCNGVMVPAEKELVANYQKNPTSLPPGYPEFRPFLYDLEVLVPGIDLSQKSKWRLQEKRPPNVAAVLYYLVWLGFVLDYIVWWVSFTLLGAALTGLLKA
ncbi:MAG: hypothetical protein ACHQZS_01780 [Candidatus Binatales bacterium]